MSAILSFVKDRAAALANDVYCEFKDRSAIVLLAAIVLKLDDLVHAMTFGREKFEITFFSLGLDPIKILPKDSQGRVRNVSIWVESASGGPTPTIRIGTASTSSNAGGARVSAGQVNELGNVSPTVELYGAASTTMGIYVIERA